MKDTSVIFITHISYLDGAIEHIKLASQEVTDFNVIITISPTQVFKNIIDLRGVNFQGQKTIVDFESIQHDWKLESFAPYFKNCKSVKFCIYHKMGSLNAIATTRKLNALINSFKPKYIHFDSYINRQIFQLPYLFRKRKKLILNVHDPKPHSGEEDRVSAMIHNSLYKWCTKFVTFSNYSKAQLQEQLAPEKKIVNSFLLPFSYYANFKGDATKTEVKPKNISFVGRISKYKGIEMFIEAISIVNKTNAAENFVIAGNPFGNYRPNYDEVKNMPNLNIIQKHLSNSELVEIMQDSKLIVCPYLDASQSGVIMTAIALNRPVLVTEAGGLKEYVDEGKNGLISKIDTQDLATKMIEFSSDNVFEKMNSEMASVQFQDDINNKYRQIVTKELYSD